MTSPRHGAPGPEEGDRPGPSRPGRHHRPSRLRLVWVYPDLLSTYGDRGNLLVLQRRARLRGIEAEAIEVNADQPVPRVGRHLPDGRRRGPAADPRGAAAARRRRAQRGGRHRGRGLLGLRGLPGTGHRVRRHRRRARSGPGHPRHLQRPRGTPRGGRDRRRRRSRARRAPAHRVREPPGRDHARPGRPAAGPGDRGRRQRRRHRRDLRRARSSAPTCTAPRSSAIPAWPTCCSPGPWARWSRCPGRTRTGRAGSARSGWPPCRDKTGWPARSVHDRLGAVGHDLGQERGRARDADSLDRVIGGDVTP